MWLRGYEGPLEGSFSQFQADIHRILGGKFEELLLKRPEED